MSTQYIPWTPIAASRAGFQVVLNALNVVSDNLLPHYLTHIKFQNFQRSCKNAKLNFEDFKKTVRCVPEIQDFYNKVAQQYWKKMHEIETQNLAKKRTRQRHC